MITAVNGHIGIAPFPKGKTVEKKMTGGMALPESQLVLVATKVLFGNKDYPAGSTVYFHGSAPMQAWAKNRYVVEGPSKGVVYDVPGERIEFIQAPESAVVFVDRG